MASISEMTSSCFALLGDIGGAELLLIFVLVLVLFGGKRLPEFARGLGKSIREFKKATSSVEEELRRVMEEPPPPPRKKDPASLPASSTPALPSHASASTGVITDEYAYDDDPYSADLHHPGPDAPSMSVNDEASTVPLTPAEPVAPSHSETASTDPAKPKDAASALPGSEATGGDSKVA